LLYGRRWYGKFNWLERNGLGDVGVDFDFIAGQQPNPKILGIHADPAIEDRVDQRDADGVVGVEYHSGPVRVSSSNDAAPAGVELLLPGAKAVPVEFRAKTEREGVLVLGPVKIGALSLTWRITRKNPSLVERTLSVTADAAQRFSIVFPFDVGPGGELALQPLIKTQRDVHREFGIGGGGDGRPDRRRGFSQSHDHRRFE
jgi:hypothetical protein